MACKSSLQAIFFGHSSEVFLIWCKIRGKGEGFSRPYTDEVESCSAVEKKYSYIGSQLINMDFDMTNECVNISYSSKCLEESLEFTAAATNDMEATILLNLPEGSQIIAPSGEVIYTVESGPGKTTVKLPPLKI